MSKPCQFDHAVSQPYTPDQCRVCWLFEFDPKHRLLWSQESARVDPTWPCSWRGDQIESQPCKTCKGEVLVKVFACGNPAIWQGKCTIAKPVPNGVVCAACSMRVPPEKNRSET